MRDINENSLKYLKLKEKRNNALANFINTLSSNQFLLFSKYLQFEEKIKKQDTLNLINNIISNQKRH